MRVLQILCLICPLVASGVTILPPAPPFSLEAGGSITTSLGPSNWSVDLNNQNSAPLGGFDLYSPDTTCPPVVCPGPSSGYTRITVDWGSQSTPAFAVLKSQLFLSVTPDLTIQNSTPANPGNWALSQNNSVQGNVWSSFTDTLTFNNPTLNGQQGTAYLKVRFTGNLTSNLGMNHPTSENHLITYCLGADPSDPASRQCATWGSFDPNIARLDWNNEPYFMDFSLPVVFGQPTTFGSRFDLSIGISNPNTGANLFSPVSVNLDFFNTAEITQISLQDSTGSNVAFTVQSASGFTNYPTGEVPEPAMLLPLGLALGAIYRHRRKRA